MAKSISELDSYTNKPINGDELMIISKYDYATQFYESKNYHISSLIDQINSKLIDYLEPFIDKLTSFVNISSITSLSSDKKDTEDNLIVSLKLLKDVIDIIPTDIPQLNMDEFVLTSSITNNFGESNNLVASQSLVNDIYKDVVNLNTNFTEYCVKNRSIIKDINKLSADNTTSNYIVGQHIVKQIYDKVPPVVQTTGGDDFDVMSQKAVTNELNKCIHKSGDSMLGKLELEQEPTNKKDATTKKYVDDNDNNLRNLINDLRNLHNDLRNLHNDLRTDFDNFNVDEEGIAKKAFDLVYPIGSVYISWTESPPAYGKWQRIASGTCLWGSNGSTLRAGGYISPGLPAITASGTISNLQGTCESAGDHRHKLSYGNSGGEGSGGALDESSKPGSGNKTTSSAGEHTHNISITGGSVSVTVGGALYGNSDTVQPPATIVSMWRRTK